MKSGTRPMRDESHLFQNVSLIGVDAVFHENSRLSQRSPTKDVQWFLRTLRLFQKSCHGRILFKGSVTSARRKFLGSFLDARLSERDGIGIAAKVFV